MSKPEIVTKVSTRMWSETISLKPLKDRLGPVAFVYDKDDDIVFFVRGEERTRRSTEYYLATQDVEITGVAGVRAEVARQARLVRSDRALGRLIDANDLKVVVWAAIFAEEGGVRIDDIQIDRSPFGIRIGLVVENYAEFDPQGVPRKLLIGPAAT